VAEEQEALRPWARKGGDKKRKTGGVLREKEELFLSSVIFDGGGGKKFIPFIGIRFQMVIRVGAVSPFLLARACAS
jgi:hypothetical protein